MTSAVRFYVEILSPLTICGTDPAQQVLAESLGLYNTRVIAACCILFQPVIKCAYVLPFLL